MNKLKEIKYQDTELRRGFWIVATLLFIGGLVIGVLALRAQEPLQPTEVEQLRLKVASQAVTIVQQQRSMLQAQWDKSEAQLKLAQKELTEAGAEIKAAHKWGEDVAFDQNSLAFRRVPPPEKKPEPKK